MGRNHRHHLNILTWDSREIEFSGDPPAIKIQDTVFGFLDEDGEGSSSSSMSIGSVVDNEVDEDAENEEKEDHDSENVGDKKFWESQNQQLQGTLYRTSSIETKIRNITKAAVKEAQEEGNAICICGRAALNGNGCKSCLMKEICGRLQNAGFNSAICKSKWRSTPDIPSGEHTFLDVIDDSNSKKEVRVIIELSFRTDFEMARGSEEYNQLIKRLPEVFVGKIERLLSLIKILCLAAKKCMKEKKMHLAPWRKHRYMQAKWLKIRERITSSKPISSSTPPSYPSRSSPARPRASMLTVDLLENLPGPGLHLTAVEVV